MLRRLFLALAFSLLAAAGGFAQEVERRTVLDGAVVLEEAPEVPERIKDALNRYQNVRGASLVDWTADGSGLFVETRFGDVSQIHRVDMPGGARRQLTFSDEPVNGIDRRPAAAEVLFSMDEGGSEFYQLFLLDPGSGEIRRLTDGESRNSGPEWSGDGERIAWTSTRRDGRSNDVWVMEVADTASARVVFEAPDGTFWGPADFSPDGRRLLIANYISITDSRVHLLDLGSGETRKLVGGDEEPASWLGVDPAFDAEGDGVFLATDSGGEFQRLVHLDLASGALTPITAEIDWNVDDFVIAPDGSRAAFVINEDAIDRLYLMDPRTFEYRRVESIPAGLIGGLEFSPDGRLGMTLNTPTTPSDVFVLETGADPADAGELVRWTESEVGGLDTGSFVEPELVHYDTFDGREIPAFLYRPRGEGPHPVIVYIHGGPESQFRPGFSSTFQLWIDVLGAAVVAPNVRGSSGYGKTYVALDNGRSREDSVKDIGALLDWIAGRPDLDQNRVAVYGGSYGGYMVLASLVHYSERLRAGVDYVGISNFVTFLENTEDYRRDLRRPEYGDERDPGMRAFLESISPSSRAGEITAALFVVQGANDPRVPASESEQIVREVRGKGRPVWYMLARNEGHGFAKKPNRDLLSQLVVLFFETHLLPPGEVAAAPGGALRGGEEKAAPVFDP
ncbi:MAG: S9 family peptidase [Gemmatimonadetes bacterium]|nr:S9 family peptidase [Gemmatimonadota bacterium]